MDRGDTVCYFTVLDLAERSTIVCAFTWMDLSERGVNVCSFLRLSVLVDLGVQEFPSLYGQSWQNLVLMIYPSLNDHSLRALVFESIP